MALRLFAPGSAAPATDWDYLKRRSEERQREASRRFAVWVKDTDSGEEALSAERLLGDNEGPILVDATDFCTIDRGTGISRVVGNLCRYFSQRPGLGIIPSRLLCDIPCDATGCFVPEVRQPGLPVLSFREMVLPDASWVYADQLASLLPAAKRRGITITTCIHDLIPLDCPEFTDKRYSECFDRWFRMMVEYSDNFLCVSETTANSVAAWLERNKTSSPRRYNIGFWHNGSAFEAKDSSSAPKVKGLDGRYCLMVGGMAPHKNHARVIDAMESIWSDGNLDLNLVVAGRTGHATTDIEERIKNHRENGRRLFRVANPPDEELAALYSNAAFVIQASLIEGFGLPVAEAAAHGRAVVLSDIPIFRELVAGKGYFFDPFSAASIAGAVRQCLADGCPPVEVPFVSWEDSAKQFADAVINRRYPIQVWH
jgi:glycosyltransferase involved in cell wall biosynthesis